MGLENDKNILLGVNDLHDKGLVVESRMLLAPYLATTRTLHLYASGGVGKTFLSLSLAHGLSTGQDFLNWKNVSGGPVKVLYIDGEMGVEELRGRMELIENASKLSVEHENLKFLTYELCPNSIMPNIAHPEVQKNFYDKCIEKVQADVIIVDNIDTCADRVNRNDMEIDIFNHIRRWANQQKSKGRAIVLIDHANKGGNEVYGTSKKNNACDVMIKLKKTEAQFPTTAQNAYELHFDKGRQQLASEKIPLWIEQFSTPTSTKFTQKPLDEVRFQYIQSLKNVQPRQVSELLGCTMSKAAYLIEKSASYISYPQGEDFEIDQEEFEYENF